MEKRENLGHLLNDILEPRVMTEAEAKFLESLPVAEFPLKRKGPAMNDQAETSELATLRAENKRLKAENLELLNDLAMLRKSDVVLAESERLRSRLAAAESLLRKSAVCITDSQSYWLNNLYLLDDINAALQIPAAKETPQLKQGET